METAEYRRKRPPRIVNAVRTAILRVEALLIARVTLPRDVSLIGAFRRGPADTGA